MTNGMIGFAGMVLAAAFLTGCDEKADVVLSPDGPVASISAAVERARTLRRTGAVTNRAVTVCVKPGRYAVSAPVILSPEDSGLHFYGPGWRKAVFSGGRALGAFRAGKEGLWETDVPENLAFEQLWVNGVRATRARTPNRHYLYMTGEDYDHPHTGFVTPARDLAPLAALASNDLSRVVVGVWQSWTMGYSPIKTIDFKKGRVELEGPIGYPLFHWKKTAPRYTLENYRAALDAPGEWFLDRAAHKLFYMPRAGERLETAVAVAPVTPALLEIRGDRARGALVRDIRFQGLGFEYTAFYMAAKGLRAAQSVANVPDAALRAADAEGLAFENCRIAHTGAHGAWFRKGCRHVTLRHCLVEDLGAGGIYFGDTSADLKRRADNAAFFEISDSIIRHGGRLMNGGIGVWLGKAHDCTVVNNDIYDFMYTGVSSGWTWGYAETVTRNLKVNYNRIHHIGQGVLSDMGGFYSLGDHTGSEVAHNWVWQVNGYGDNGSPAWGLYTDEGSKGIVFHDNLVEQCRDGAIHQHYGTENIHSNNIYATFRRFGAWRSRNEDHVTIRVMNNIFYWNDPAAGAYTGGGGLESLGDLPADGNLYWCTAGAVATNAFKGVDFATWQKIGKDAHGRIADPKFADPAHGDWRVTDGSPALALGFKPFDWRAAGVRRDDAAWVRCAAERTWDAFEDAPKAPRFHLDRARVDFERFHVGPLKNAMGGLLPFNAQMGKVGGFAFTDKGVKNGKRALVVTDAPENTRSYWPHLFLPCAVTAETAVVRFLFKPVKSSGMQLELRDYTGFEGGNFATGVSLDHHAGFLRVSGRNFLAIAQDTWTQVEVRLNLTGARAGTWMLSVTPEGAPTKTETFPRYRDKRFKGLTWVGFMTNGKGDAVWQLDDFALEHEP